MTYEEIKRTIPWQFRDSPKLNSILKAWATQEAELIKVFEELNTLTLIDEAEGELLDRIGNIVTLTRTDAYRILGYPQGVSITDDVYRRCLKFKILYNNTTATYPDIRKGIEYLWEGIHCHYEETVDRPATFQVVLDDVNLDDLDPYTSMPLIIKPAGVQSVLFNNFISDFTMTDREKFNNDRLIWEAYWTYDGTYYYNNVKPYDAEVEEVAL